MTVYGSFTLNGLLSFDVDVALPELNVRGHINAVLSTGAPSNVISSIDAQRLGIISEQLKFMPHTDQFGTTYMAADADAIITFTDSDGQTHPRPTKLQIRHPKHTAAPNSILSNHVIRDFILTFSHRKGQVTLRTTTPPNSDANSG